MELLIVVCVIIFLIFFSFSKKESPNLNGDEIVFKSAFTRGTDITAPEMLIFDQSSVTWRKNRGAGWFYAYSDSITIPYGSIVGIKTHSKMVGSDVEIIGKGVQSIYASNFKGSDVKIIEKIIKEIMKNE